MTSLLKPAGWPLTAKVPALVAVLVIALAAVDSTALLYGIAREQRQHTTALGTAYLEGVTASLGLALARQDVWDAYDTLDRSRRAFGPGRLVRAVAILPDGHVLASTDPRALPVGSAIGREADDGSGEVASANGDLLRMAKDVGESGVRLGRVVIDLNTRPEHLAREKVAMLLMAVNSALALACAIAGWWLTWRMLRPVHLLTSQFALGAEAAPRVVPSAAFGHFSPEFASLFSTYNRMVRSAAEREALAARLAEDERLATLGALAGSMAHEVNNPLGGMLMAVDTIAVHGSDETVRMQSLGLVRRGLENIRTIVRATLVIYKTSPGTALLTPEALDDLRYLVGPEAARRNISVSWDNRLLGSTVVDVAAVRQAVLNVVLNAVVASPTKGVVRVIADQAEGMLRIRVGDDGQGLPPAAQALLDSAGDTPPVGSTGLGLWTAVRVINAAGGRIWRASSTVGTALVLLFPTDARHEPAA